MSRSSFLFNGIEIPAGASATVNIEAARLYDFTPMRVPVKIIHGQKDGPTLFVTAAIHGDELNGVEIIRRLLLQKSLHRLSGTLIAVPIVNIYGFNTKSRYLPDNRDLNRSFPGSPRGSLASQMAYGLMNSVVKISDYGIDLHTGAQHRTNLPHIRALIDDQNVADLAKRFGTPVILNSNLRDGSLRHAALEHGVKILLYEAGEALRFSEPCIRAGLKGILSVMAAIGMIRRAPMGKISEPQVARSSTWIRAPQSGIVATLQEAGRFVQKDEVLGMIVDPYGSKEHRVLAPGNGVIIGHSCLPVVNRGDALLHLAFFEDLETIRTSLENFDEEFSGDLS